MNCPFCNQTLPADASFCNSCGSYVGSNAKTAAMYARQKSVISPTVPADFGEAVHRCFSLYSISDGRASLAEFWYWQLFVVLTYCLPLGCVLGLASAGEEASGAALLAAPLMIWGLALLCPSINVCVRRLHDINCSGALFLLVLLGYIGIPILMIMMMISGTTGDNKYGRQPVVSANPDADNDAAEAAEMTA